MSGGDDRTPDYGIAEFQRRIAEIYGERDRTRGVAGTFVWFVEEVGELARGINHPSSGGIEEQEEFADCLAWLVTLASLRGIDLADAARRKYGAGCPRCGAAPCRCRHRAVPSPPCDR